MLYDGLSVTGPRAMATASAETYPMRELSSLADLDCQSCIALTSLCVNAHRVQTATETHLATTS